MIRAALVVLSLVFAIPATTHAFCRSLSVVSASGSCMQPCLRLEDFSAEEIAERRIVELGWRRSCIEYVIDARDSVQLTEAEVEAIYERSVQTWMAVTCDGAPIDFDVRMGPEPGLCDVPEYVSGGPNANTMAFVSNWSGRGHASGAFALTTTWFDTGSGEIYDADMEINQQTWVFADCPDTGCEDDSVVDLQNTVTHELGHFFGLAHTPDDEDATMWACADTGEIKKRTLEADDIDGLCSIYPPGSLPDECDYTPRGGFDPLCRADRPKEDCGCSAPGLGGAPSAAWLSLGLLLFIRLRRR